MTNNTTKAEPVVTLEQAITSCPQCEGEGGYPDGVDEDACHTDCTRCAGAGWIVDLPRLAAQAQPEGLREAVEQAATWFDEYAAEHDTKAWQATDGKEKASRNDKAARNKHRADYLRAALSTVPQQGVGELPATVGEAR